MRKKILKPRSLLALSTLMLLFAETATFAQVPYYTDFESGAGPEWSVASTDDTEPYFTRFSGRFSNTTQTLTLTNLTVGQSYTVGFDFYALDSLDGNSGPDYFVVAVGTNEVFRETIGNYNTQSFARQPDEGRSYLGFNPNYYDAVYRDVEISFVASNSTETVSFRGENLQPIDDESWGIDNVAVRLSSSLTNTLVHSSTLPSGGTTNSTAIESFSISATRPLLASSAGNAANYSLREAGVNGVFGDGDDVVQTITPSFSSGRTVSFAIANGPLQPGKYRFETTSGLLDTNSLAVAVFTRDFTVAHPVLGRIENLSNDTQASATALATTESPAASGFLTAYGVGTFSSTSDLDFWRFDAEAGDRITVRVESGIGVYPQLYLQNASGQNLTSVGGSYEGIASFQNYTFSAPGTYYLRVYSNNKRSWYRLRIDQGRNLPLESENNDSQGNANALNFLFSPGIAQARVAGALPGDDASGDFFNLGVLNIGNSITVNVLSPAGSSLTTNPPTLTIQSSGNSVALATNTSGSLNYTVVSNGFHYVRIESGNRGIRAQYLLNVTMNDGVAPVVTSTSLPAEGTGSDAILSAFTVNFSEEMSVATVTNSSAYELRCAGTDGIFNNSDDALYLITNAYTGGLSASCAIADGPLQPGNYRLTVKTNLADRASNPMSAPFVQTFSITNAVGFVMENRTNDTAVLGASFSPTPSTNADGTIGLLANYGVSSYPQSVAAADFNGDTNLDLVTANFGGDNVTVLTNLGDGTFRSLTNIPTGDGAVFVGVEDFNHDGKQDVAVANYYAGTISILLADGTGGFQVATNYSGFSSPYNIAIANFNGDSHPDLAVANYGGGTVTVLLGNGDGSFGGRTNYTAGSNPQWAAAGDLNGDSIADLAVANYSSASVSIFFGNGDGSFQTVTNLAVGRNPRFVAIADVTGDATNDLVVLQPNDNTVGVLAGKGDGTFQTRTDYNTGTSDPYHAVLADFNGDNRLDIVVPGYGNNWTAMMLNDGFGRFTNTVNYNMGTSPIAAAAGDFNRDGRMDVAFVNYYGHYVGVWLGNHGNELPEVLPGLRTAAARGNLSSDADVDYFQFSGTAGDIMTLAVENPGYPGWTGLYYRIERPDGQSLTSFGADYTGWGQSSPITLPQTGTYFVRVTYNYSYRGEYRLRVTTVHPPMQMESEDNSSLGQANTPSLALTNGHLKAAVAGYISYGDNNGDFYYLGTLGEATTVNLNVALPASSTLVPSLEIWNSSGPLATNAAGTTNLTFTAPAGAVYARVTRASGTGGLLAQYVVNIDLQDTQAPAVVSDTFPTNGTTSSNIIASFTVGFNEQMNPAFNALNRSVYSYNGHRYLVTDSSTYWSGAEAQAVALGGHLATINDQAENDWLTRTFSPWGNLWIGLSDAAIEGNFVWSSGELFSFTNWNSGQPDNYNNEDFVQLITSGRWYDYGYTTARGIIEVSATTDSDADGLPDVMDPYPNDRFNGFDLRSAGVDGLFDTSDDVVYNLDTVNYSGGLSANFAIVDGPLQPGNYRFKVTTAVKDRSGNPLAEDYVKTFTIAAVSGLVMENRDNNSPSTATSLSTSPTNSPDGSFTVATNIGVGSNPYYILAGQLNGDTNLDLVVANYNGNSISLLLGNGTGAFQFQTNIGVGSGAIGVAAGDFNQDSKPDLAVANDYSSSITLLTNDGAGVFQVLSNYSVGSRPHAIVQADFNGDGRPDLATANLNANTVTVLLGLTNGGFAAGVDYGTGSGTYYVAAGDLNNDGKIDLVTANYYANTLSLLLGNGDGTFQAATTLPTGSNPRNVAIGRLNNDTNLDLAVFNYNDSTISIYMGNGDGTFQARVSYSAELSDIYHFVLADADNDGQLDIIIPNYGYNRVTTLFNQGNGVFGPATQYSMSGNPICLAVGDFNSDGRPDIATANWNYNSVTVMLGNHSQLLSENPVGSGIRSSAGRGNLSNSSDVDYWSFSAVAGDRLVLACDNPGNPYYSGLSYSIYRPDGGYVTSFSADYRGWGQCSPVTLPVSGTYTVRVSYNYEYWGEYRIRVTLVRPPRQLESEDNSSTGSANSLTYAFSTGHQKASVLGYISSGDGSGDFYRLGNLSLGTTIILGLQQPTDSPLSAIIGIYDWNGNLVTNTTAGATNLTYVIPNGADGSYFARVTAASGAGLFSQYLLDIDLADTLPPWIAGDNLPAEGTTVSNILDRFTLNFSEDMTFSTVTNAANYELRNAGADGLFGTSDDIVYGIVNSPSYSSGLSASYFVTTAPLQPGKHRLTVAANLSDRAGNQIPSAYVRTFTVAGVPGFILENQSNDSAGLATSISATSSNAPDGSFTFRSGVGVGSQAHFLAAGQLNNDTNLDLVVANYGSGTISVLTGNGNGAFNAFTNYSTPSPVTPALGLFNADSNLDLAVVNYGANMVTLFVGNGDGTFLVSSNYAVGSQPHCIATGDFNADGTLDLATANYNSDNISVLLGNGDGTFRPAVNYSSGRYCQHVAVGDFNADGKLDLVAANPGADNVALLLGNGDGTFASAITMAAGSSPKSVAVADLNNDGKLDIAAVNGGDNTITVLFGNGDGSFQPRVNFGSGTSESYKIIATDLNADNRPDLAVSSFYGGSVIVFLNNGNGTFQSGSTYGGFNYPIGLAPGDFNNDGRADIAVANYNGNDVRLLLGNDTEFMTADGTDVRVGTGRGNLSSNSDVDYWSFSGTAGDRFLGACEVPGNPSGSGLRFVIYRPDGSYITDWYGDYYGRGQRTLVLPVSGTYTIRVEYNYGYYGEYRLRVTLVKPPIQLESEDNNGTGQANTLSLSLAGGHQSANVAGALTGGDPADFFRLGNLGPGCIINLAFTRPVSSGLSPILGIYNSSGTALTNTVAGASNLTFSVTAADQYFARIAPANSSEGLFSVYFLGLDVFDAAAPAVTSVTLPADGVVTSSIINRFSIGFSKDLDTMLNALNRSVQFYGGHAYWFCDSWLSWLNAESQARAQGGHLAIVNDAAENTWLRATYSGDFWIGFTDEAQEGNFVWANGDPVSYTNWNSGEPNNSGNEDYAVVNSSGRWVDVGLSSTYHSVFEFSGTDSDGDGLPDTFDPYPLDALNLFDLRAAGADGVFDTSDDAVYRLTFPNYSSGLSVDFSIANGPLQPGNYRFRVTSSLRDRFGNTLASPFDRYFTIENVPGYTIESRSNNSLATATPLLMVEDPPGVRTGGGRGSLFDNGDYDCWSFAGTAGDLLMLSTQIPGNPGGTQLHYEVYGPDGTRVIDFYPAYTGEGQTAPYTLPVSGTYTIVVSVNYGYYGEYRLRATLLTAPVQMESEDNGSIGAANPMTLTASGESRFGSAMGYIRTGTDNDYFNLGTLTNGSTVFINVRQPAGSRLIPVVSVYNASNVYQNEAGSGRSSDGVAEVRITQTGVYYAVVRGAEGISGLDEQYVLDVQVLPTGSVSFPNLQVISITPPSGSGIESGQPVTFSFTVQNVGSLETPASNWLDRVVMSTNAVLGDSDDIPLGVFAHTGVLNAGDNYLVTQTVTLPHGIAGAFYVIVQTDSGNAVNEFVLEGDNVTVSSSTFNVARANYPDLRVENLSVIGPDTNNVFTIQWNTANRGTTNAPAGFRESLLVRNQTTAAVLLNAEQTITNALAANATLPHMASVTTTNPGNYLVQVTTDSGNNVYEFDAVSHASAELNTVATNFQIIQYFTVAVLANPTNGGALTGAGVYAAGSTVTVTAIPNTNQAPYQFVNWTENGSFQSANAVYSFPANRDWQLIANFVLPSYQIGASNNPANAGNVAGIGTYFWGITNVLTAYANPGYRFTNWTETGTDVGTNTRLTTVVYSNRFVVANYVEANPFHDVTAATLPAGLATVTGAGFYTNGQTGQITAPLSITNPPNVHSFSRFTLNGAFFGTNATFQKVFSTLDPTNMEFVAEYTAESILPLVTNVSASMVNPVPLTTNFVLTFRFNRSMQTSAVPVVMLTNSSAAAVITLTNGGIWQTGASSNDTFATAPINFSAGMDGTFQVFVSAARDLNNAQLAPTNVASISVDATPPVAPTLTLVASNASSATVGWSSYAAPGDLGSFRVYLETNSFSSAAGLVPVTGLSVGVRQYQASGLTLDRQYFIGVSAVDLAGNAATNIVPLGVVLPSTVPPPVSVQVTATGPSSATVSWTSYNTASLFGFAGFRLFYEQTNFASVTGLSARQTLDLNARSALVENLDRTKTYSFAVVGFNGTNGFNPAVATASWSDPYAGTIAADMTIGGGSQNEVAINQSIIVTNNAVLTIVPGTTLRFAPGTGITIAQGQLVADGTALDPITFTSSRDVAGQSPAAGDWTGIVLNSGANNSVLRHVWVKYGAGLTLNGVAPTVDAFTALYNAPNGIALQNGAALTTADALLTFNGVGIRQSDTAQVTIRNSVIKNNGTNAFAGGSGSLVATQDWWGTTVSADIASHNAGTVNTASFLTSEPVLTPALGTVGNVTQVGSRNVTLRFACRTAESMRVSENSAFPGVFFAPFASQQTFQISEGGGQKTIFVQYRSATGQTNPPVSITLQYITAGPVIQSFSLAEGQVLTRPLIVTGSATAALGMAGIEFYVDDGLQTNVVGGNYSQRFDIRGFSSGIHRVKLLARDNSANFSILERNVLITLDPPPAPSITAPASDLVVNTNRISISGTAEPLVGVRVTRNGQVVANLTAAENGAFSATNISLVEGQNAILATAFDAIGQGSSSPREVVLDSGAPAQLIMDAPVYRPGAGLEVTWHFATSGERATRFQLFWHTAPFASTNEASGHSLILDGARYTAQGLANGTYYFGVIGFDSAGNASPLSALVPFAYDAVPPSFTVTYDRVPPFGVGPVRLTLSASETLSGKPSLTLTPSGSSTPVLISLTNTALTTYEGSFNVSSSTPSGRATLNVVAQDLSSNQFSGAPSGAEMVIDVTPPVASITTAPAGPVQTTTPTNVTVNLTLSEPPKSGTTPALSFVPPTNSTVAITLSGSATNWTGQLTLNAAMGSGFGRFALSASDAVDNLGTNISSGAQLEIYNTALPTAPALPANLQALVLSAGQIRLTWNSVSNAEIYRLYREPGTNAVVPTVLVADNLISNSMVDLPPSDGAYRYAVSASRRGSESAVSNLVIAVSDRTPPPAPINVAAQLVSSGIQVSWEQPTNGESVASFRIYRNGALIRTVASASPIIDSPPRGVMNYTVASVDAAGNENLSAPASIELLVGAVNNLQALVRAGQAPALSWTSDDPTAVGFNVYRNGVKANATLIAGTSFTDSQYSGNSLAQYSVRAVNASTNESAPRVVDVHRVEFGLLVNPAGAATNHTSFIGYFDQYQVAVSNLTVSGTLPLQTLEVRRTIPGIDPMTLTRTVNQSLSAGANYAQDIIAPSAAVTGTQTLRLRAVQATDIGGSSVTYEQTFEFKDVNMAQSMAEIYANQLPLAGGLSQFQVRLFNRGYAAMDVITAKNNGSDPGEVYISVRNSQGQEVSRTEFTGTPSGTTFLGDGRGFVRVAPGGSIQFTVPNVLVPESLASNVVTFQVVVGKIYYRLGNAAQVESGPLSGSMISSLSQTPYYGTLQTDHTLYANDTPVIITGQAINRATGLPMTNVALKIGFASRGYRWYRDVTTDTNGNYQYTYNATPGLSGTLTLWAAHPLVYDALNQAQIDIYRVYATPPRGDIRMSKNDTFDFSISLVNPGELTLTNFTSAFRAYTLSGTNETPIATVTGTAVLASDFGLTARQTRSVVLQLHAATNAPDNAVVEFTLTSGEGASATFVGNLTLLPAVPVLTVVQPNVGYVEVSVDRGTLVSRTVTIANRGLRELQGVELIPPTNVAWMAVNLPISGDGKIRLPDMGVGDSNTFQVVFAPPADTALDYYQDAIHIRGTNSPQEFAVNLYALVTSDKKGSVQFHVDNILGQNVPNATIRMRNILLQTELTPVLTDDDGLVTITNIQEGQWSWQASAPGHSSTVGSIEVVPNQTVLVDTRLSKSLVTVTFQVVPVPYTDKYEIKIEQTFETHVPAPVLVIDPAYKEFKNVTPGFEANFIATAKNYGLIEMTDVTITGASVGEDSLTPLITYLPKLLPQQEVEIPFRFTHGASFVLQQSAQKRQFDSNDFWGCIAGGMPIGMANFLNADVARGIGAIFNSEYRCVSDQELAGLQASLVVVAGLSLAADVFTSSADFIAGYVGSVISCIVGNFLPDVAGTAITGPGPRNRTEYDVERLQCFVAGTPVTMADGSRKAVEKVQPGDWVRTGNGRESNAKVAQVYSQTVRQICEITVEMPDTGKRLSLQTTPEHLFWVDSIGWVSAGGLSDQHWLFTETGQRVRVAGNRFIKQPAVVYTFRNAGDAAFYANGILVHDMCGVETSEVLKVEAAR